jgi:plastocyanin
MRFYAYAFAASALVLGACGGGEKTADSAAAAPSADTTAAAPAPAPNAATPATPAGAATAAPITGQTVEVKMVGDAKGYRFEPANVTIKKGDGIKFTMVSGGPHNVAFDPAGIPAGSSDQLNANMGSDKMADLQSNLKANPGESVTISFANVPSGAYNYHCTPHLAMGMKGVITVQ